MLSSQSGGMNVMLIFVMAIVTVSALPRPGNDHKLQPNAEQNRMAIINLETLTPEVRASMCPSVAPGAQRIICGRPCDTHALSSSAASPELLRAPPTPHLSRVLPRSVAGCLDHQAHAFSWVRGADDGHAEDDHERRVEERGSLRLDRPHAS